MFMTMNNVNINCMIIAICTFAGVSDRDMSSEHQPCLLFELLKLKSTLPKLIERVLVSNGA